MRDLASTIGLVPIIGPVVLSADNTPAAIDLAGFRSAAFAIAVGVGGITFDATNKIEIKLRHGDTSTAADHVAVDDVDVIKFDLAPTDIATGIVRSLVAAHAAATIQKLGYIGNKRYVSFLVDFSGTHGTGTPIAIMLIKGDPGLSPVA